MFRVVVEKKYVPADIMKLMEQKPIMLPSWDPMFAPEEKSVFAYNSGISILLRQGRYPFFMFFPSVFQFLHTFHTPEG